MVIYHVNPETGATGACSAVSGKCPFGSLEQHFSSPKLARKAYEATQNSLIPSLGKRKAEALILGELVDVDLLNRMIQEKIIYTSIHPKDDSYVLFCYTVLAQIRGKWNDATKMARGLIVQRDGGDFSNANVIARPWNKFFTLQQRESGWHLGDEENETADDGEFAAVDFNAPASVYDKMDGSLGILYRGPDGLPALATKGSFDSEQARTYTRLLQRDEKTFEASKQLLEKNPAITPLFELVGPKNRIVLKYDETQIVLLGGSIKANGNSVEPETLTAWNAAGLPVVERMEAKTLTEALALPTREGREGLVVSLAGDHPMKLKIKQDDYLRLHRIVTMFSKKESRALVQELERKATYGDFLTIAKTKDVSHFEEIKAVLEVDGFSKGDDTYEFVKERRESYFKDILLPRAEAVAEAKAIVDSLDESFFTGENPKKDFAAKVTSFAADRASLFELFRARLDGRSLDEVGAFQEIRRAIQNVKDTSD